MEFQVGLVMTVMTISIIIKKMEREREREMRVPVRGR